MQTRSRGSPVLTTHPVLTCAAQPAPHPSQTPFCASSRHWSSHIWAFSSCLEVLLSSLLSSLLTFPHPCYLVLCWMLSQISNLSAINTKSGFQILMKSLTGVPRCWVIGLGVGLPFSMCGFQDCPGHWHSCEYSGKEHWMSTWGGFYGSARIISAQVSLTRTHARGHS